MKNIKRSKYMFLVLSCLLFSCKDNEVFKQEMYKNVVALISSTYYNNFEEIVPLTGEEVTGYVSASVGGTFAPEKDLTINLIEENTPFDKFNWSLYDGDIKRYAKLLPKDKYEIPETKIIIKKGERTGRALIKIRPDGLSPDSTYFISLQAVQEDGIELNPSKNNVLYKVMIFNQFASQATNSLYNMTGLQNGGITAGSKKLFPLTKNSVRMIAGTESFVNNESNIANTSLVLEVSSDNKVTIKPFKNLKIEQIDGNSRYPNTFQVEESYGRKFNVFSINYKYTIGKVTREMQEDLRMEVR